MHRESLRPHRSCADKPTRSRAGLAAFVLSFTILCAPAYAAPKEELLDLRGRIEALKKELESKEGVRDEAADALRKSEKSISELSRQLRELDQAHEEATRELTQVRAETDKVRNRIDGLRRDLGVLLREQYIFGEQDYLTTLLNNEDPNKAARELHYLTYLSRARARLVETLQGELKTLAALEQTSKARQETVARLKEERLARQAALVEEQAKRKAVLASISKELANQRRQIGKMQRDEKRLTQLVERLSRIVTKPAKPAKPSGASRPQLGTNERIPDASFAGTPFQELKGKLHLPVRGELANRFGSPREDTGTEWKGLFIRARAGQEVRAVASGRVVFADWLRGFGNLLIIDHGSGYMSLYGNNESLYRQVGDRVKAGDAVAVVGNSGGSPESGVYFELRRESKPFDPLSWTGK